MRLVRGAAVTVLGVVLLAGCSDGGTANETLPPTSSTPAAETSADLTPLGPPDLPMPPEAREQSAAGAEAFVRYYMDIYTAAQASMDPTYLDEFSRGCGTCSRISEEIRTDASAGYRYEGGQITVEFADAILPDRSAAEVVFAIRQAALAVVDSQGQRVTDLQFAEHRSPNCGAILGWDATDSAWVLSQWDIN